MAKRFTINPEKVAENRRRNFVHATVLISAIVLLLGAVGFMIAGVAGLIWIATFGFLAMMLGPRLSQQVMLQMYSATELKPQQVPMLFELVDELCERGGIKRRPRLFYIPSRLMLAFTVGGRDDIIIAVSDGLLRQLTGREIAGVLAHELAHVAHGDLKLMALADFMTKITRFLALVALLLLLVNLPYLQEEGVAIPWPPIALLAAAPALSLLLQLGLSRAREYDADAGAAMLTGDPGGIASALVKMDAQQRRYWENIFGRQGSIDQPSLLRSHPKTDERVRMLEEMVIEEDDGMDLPDNFIPGGRDEVRKSPRRRYHGFRY